MKNCSVCISNLKVFDLEAPVTQDILRQAYRDLAKVWHPDRFQSDARLASKAEEQFKRIQVAYQDLLLHFELHREGQVAGAERKREDARTDAAHPNSRVDALLTVLTRWADNRRFFVGASIPTRFIDQVNIVHEDLPDQLLGIVDVSMTGTGRTFLAFIPRGLVSKTLGLGRSAELLDYDEFLKEAVLLDKGLDIEPDFFDRLAYGLGIDRRKPEAPLSVRVGRIAVSDGLDNDGARRLFNLLSELKDTLKSVK